MRSLAIPIWAAGQQELEHDLAGEFHIHSIEGNRRWQQIGISRQQSTISVPSRSMRNGLILPGKALPGTRRNLHREIIHQYGPRATAGPVKEMETENALHGALGSSDVQPGQHPPALPIQE